MTPENDQDGPVRPPVLDLEAQDMTAEPEPETESAKAEAETEAPPPTPSRAGRHWAAWSMAALILLALIAGAWVYKGYGQRFWPSDEMTIMARRLSALEATSKTLTSQMSGLGATFDQTKTETSRLSDELKAAQGAASDTKGAITALQDADTKLQQRIEETGKAVGETRAAVDALKQSIATAGGNVTVSPADPAALAALTQRVETLERDLASLKAEGGKPGNSAETVALLSQTLADLKAKFAAGAPYRDEWQRISQLVPAAPGLEVLEPFADKGLPNTQSLAKELDAVIATLPAPAEDKQAAPSDSYWNRFVGLLGSIVTIRRLDDTDWRDIARRAQAYAESGDLRQAVDLLAKAEGQMPAPLADWRNKAGSRLKAEAALEDVSGAVLRQIAALERKP